MVDLSKLKPKYNAKAKSNMKNVLTEYGLPDSTTDEHQSNESDTNTKKTQVHISYSFIASPNQDIFP